MPPGEGATGSDGLQGTSMGRGSITLTRKVGSVLSAIVGDTLN
jgi:hypothetical protein